jgi:hypothetical protein
MEAGDRLTLFTRRPCRKWTRRVSVEDMIDEGRRDEPGSTVPGQGVAWADRLSG